MTRRNVTGHVFTVKRKRGPQWYAKWREPSGKQVQERLGHVWQGKGRPPDGYLTKRKAQERLEAKLTDLRRGIGERVETGATFGGATAAWLHYVEHDRKRRASTVRDYTNLAGQLRRDLGENVPLEAVTSEIIDAYRRRLLAETKLSARTINKRLVCLHAIFQHAKVRPNPVADVERQPLKRSGDIDVLSPTEVAALVRAAENDQDAAIFTVAAYTGLRLGELLALRWADVDFGKRLIHVRRSYTLGKVDVPKSGRVRSVPLIDQAAAALDGLSKRERWTGDAELVFVDAVGGVVDQWALRERFYAALAEAELRRVRFHDLRHCFGTLAVQAFPLSDVRAFMGHADIQTTMIYVHHVPQVDAAERLSQLVSESVSPTVSPTVEIAGN